MVAAAAQASSKLNDALRTFLGDGGCVADATTTGAGFGTHVDALERVLLDASTSKHG